MMKVHTSVLLKESIEELNIKPDGVYLDGTLGRAGHTAKIARMLETGRLIAIDCDCDAIEEVKKLLTWHRNKVTFICDNFRNMAKILEKEGVETVDGMIFDLGVSSPQLDDAARGFSYMKDAKLDMRMDKSNPLTAFKIVNTWHQYELSKIFFAYGEERYAKQIAREIVRKRKETPIRTTFELNKIIYSAIPAAARREPQHPSKRCFQALRIAVGDELGALEEMLNAAPELLSPGGRICVISFHSLEDRLVKKAFNEHAKGCICPKNIPVCVCNLTPKLKLITRKPIMASADEVKHNPRARSAKLRVAERI